VSVEADSVGYILWAHMCFGKAKVPDSDSEHEVVKPTSKGKKSKKIMEESDSDDPPVKESKSKV
jgi:hypothetical protein